MLTIDHFLSFCSRRKYPLLIYGLLFNQELRSYALLNFYVIVDWYKHQLAFLLQADVLPIIAIHYLISYCAFIALELLY